MIFAEHRTASLPAANNRHRLKIFRRFIDKWHECALDVGASNYISEQLGVESNTVGDLNYGMGTTFSHYVIITNFEVLNHIQNPRHLIEDCFRRLIKGGTMYLSTPKAWLITWYHGDNFVEYKREPLERLFKDVGFQIVKYEVHNPWPWWFAFTGVRPFFRYIFNRFHLWQLSKP